LFEKVEQGNMAWKNPSLSFCHRLPPARPSPEEFLYDSMAATDEMSNLGLHNSDLFVEQDRRGFNLRMESANCSKTLILRVSYANLML
jgi:hypothetical protein